MQDIEVMKRISDEDIIDFLVHKSPSQENLNCPFCREVGFTLIDSEPVKTPLGEVDIDGIGKAVMQTIIPTHLYPRIGDFEKLLDENKIDKKFDFLRKHLSHMSAANSAMLPVIHLACNNCGHIRTFSKSFILNALKEIKDGK